MVYCWGVHEAALLNTLTEALSISIVSSYYWCSRLVYTINEELKIQKAVVLRPNTDHSC